MAPGAVVAAAVAMLVIAGCGPGGATVTGRVVLTGSTGRVRAGVTLEGMGAVSVTPAADGTWRADHLTPGIWIVVATAEATREGRRTTMLKVPAIGTVVAPTLTFQAIGAIAGRVTYAGAGPPPVGTVVAAAGTGAVARPDAHGAFELDGVPTGDRQVVATSPDGSRVVSPTLTVRQGNTTEAPTLALVPPAGPSATLSGRVVVTGETDASGAAITLSGPVEAAAVTAADGSYIFAALPAGHYLVTASLAHTREGDQTATVVVAQGGAQAPDLTFTPTGSVQGQATIGGAATGNAGITILVQGPGSAAALGYTDDAGVYLIDGAPVGPVTVTAMRPGDVATGTATGTVAWGQATTLGAVALVSAGYTDNPIAFGTFEGYAPLEGVADSSGTQVGLLGGVSLPVVFTDADGAFRLDSVPLGAYSARFAAGPYQDTLPDLLMLPGTNPMILHQGTLSPLPTFTLERGTRVATTAEPTRVVSSPDGRWLLAFAPAAPGGSVGTLYQVDLKDGGVAALDSDASGDLVRFAGSGDTVLYLQQPIPGAVLEGNLVAVDPATGAARTLGTSVAAPSVEVSADGTRVTFVELQTPNQTGSLFAAAVDQGAASHLAGDAVAAPAVVTAAGDILYATHTPATTPAFALESVPAAGGSPTHLADGADGQLLLLSTDQKTVYFSDDLGRVDSVPAAGGTAKLVVEGVRCLRETPDRKALLCFGTGGSDTPLERVDLASHQVTVLDAGATVGPLVISPDGTRIACASGTGTVQDLDVAAIDGSGATTVGTSVAAGAFAFSSDGTRLLVVDHLQPLAPGSASAGDLELVALGAGTTTRLDQDVWAGGAPAFSGDGSRAVYLGQYQSTLEGTVRSVPLTGGTPDDLVAPATGVWHAGNAVFAWHGGEPPGLAFRDGLYRLPSGAP